MSHPVQRGPRVGIVLFVASLVLAACGAATPGQATPAPAALTPVMRATGERLHAVATTNIVADVVAQVGGDHIRLTALLPTAADPHTYQPVPQDLRAVAEADVVFANGLGLEAFLDELIANAGGRAPLVAVSAGVPVIAFAVAGEEHPDDDAHDHDHDADPHTWMTPRNVITWTQNIEAALSQLDPAHAADYRANAEAYIAQLNALDSWIREQVAAIPEANRLLVTDHAIFGYLADAYGFTPVGTVVASFSLAVEPSAQELAQLEDRIRQSGVRAVFVGTTVNPTLAAQVASDTGTQLVRVYTGSLSEPGGDAATYLEFMRYNIRAIVAALT